MESEPVLEVRNLKKYFSQQTNLLDTLLSRDTDKVQAVDDVSFTLHENESQGIIGESGCGKTTLLMTLMGLYDPTDGEILFKGEPISEYGRKEWKEFRSNVQIIFQDPFNSLDPKMTIREALTEPLKIHNMGDHDRRVREVLERVELNPPEQYLDRFPRQLSGGEKQRVSIARALVVEPDLILADEPTSMLDVSTQASLLNLLSELIDDLGVSMLYISHDLSTVSYICQSINVMYLGRIVESAPTKAILNAPKHPYSQALIDAVPIPDPHHKRERTKLEGAAQEPINLGEGCRFAERCPEAMDICKQTPAFVDVTDEADVDALDVDFTDKEWRAACHLYYDHEEFMASGAAEEMAGEHVTSEAATDGGVEK